VRSRMSSVTNPGSTKTAMTSSPPAAPSLRCFEAAHPDDGVPPASDGSFGRERSGARSRLVERVDQRASVNIRPRRQGTPAPARTRADNVIVLILLFVALAWAAGLLVALALCAGAATGDRALAR